VTGGRTVQRAGAGGTEMSVMFTGDAEIRRLRAQNEELRVENVRLRAEIMWLTKEVGELMAVLARYNAIAREALK